MAGKFEKLILGVHIIRADDLHQLDSLYNSAQAGVLFSPSFCQVLWRCRRGEESIKNNHSRKPAVMKGWTGCPRNRILRGFNTSRVIWDKSLNLQASVSSLVLSQPYNFMISNPRHSAGPNGPGPLCECRMLTLRAFKYPLLPLFILFPPFE